MSENKKIKLIVNDKEIEVESGITLIQACSDAGISIPRFCYHDRLKIAGNCRMCLVELVNPKSPKPVASCATDVSEGMIVNTESEMVKKARAGVMEFLLINHPLDCPICDQAGECDLQDQAYVYGKDRSFYNEEKRSVTEKNLSPFIKTNMTRCIHCTRCVRFMDEVAGTGEIGAFGRGENMEIDTFLQKNIKSEMSGNIVDICPVGALTSKTYSFRARPWELQKTESIDIMDAVCSNIRIDSKNGEILRILPRLNEEINEEWISDKTRYSYDGLSMQRIDSPYIKNKEGKYSETTIDQAIESICTEISRFNPDEIAILIGDLVDMETAYMAKKLIETISTPNYECRQDGAKINGSARGNYIMNTGIAGIANCDNILIIGSNPRLEAPIVNLKIRQAYLNGGKVFNIGENLDLNYKYNQVDDSLAILADIYEGKTEYNNSLKNASKPAILIGQNALYGKHGSDVHNITMAIADKYGIINSENNWNGYNMLHKAAGRVGAIDLGLYTKDLDVDTILDRCQSGQIKMLISIGSDEINTEKIKDTFIVYIGTHGDKIANMANVILPGSCYTEKNSIYTNTEGRVQFAFQAVPKIGSSMDDSEIILKICKRLSNNSLKNKVDIIPSMLSEFSFIKEYINNHAPCKVLFDEITKIKTENLPKTTLLSHLGRNIFTADSPITRSSVNMSRYHVS